MFKELTASEEVRFRDWARTNFDGSEANPLWHPVVRDEWAKAASALTEHEFHGGAAGSFASEGCPECQAIDLSVEP
jgi:hypothetical protein